MNRIEGYVLPEGTDDLLLCGYRFNDKKEGAINGTSAVVAFVDINKGHVFKLYEFGDY